MQLSFPNGERQAVGLSRRSVTIGSADGDDITISHASLVPAHACLVLDDNGVYLALANGNEARVNQRPIAKRAILRPGDHIELGAVTMRLSGPQPQPDRESPVDADNSAGQCVLRGLAGPNEGRALPIEPVTINADSEQTVDFTWRDGRIVLANADHIEVRVNGNVRASGELNPGDQISFGDQRLMLEAAGFVPSRDYLPCPTTTQPTTLNKVDSGLVRRDRWIYGGLLGIAIFCFVVLLILRG